MICAFRLDDITPNMDWERFERVMALFGKYHILPLLGVVPDNQDQGLSVMPAKEEFYERMRLLQKDGVCLAQHGLHHVYETKKSGILGLNPFSEFAGLPYEKQLEKIKKGKEILQNNGICVTIFMAPGHTYDKLTLKALSSCGFRYVTDGYARCSYTYKGLIFIPSRSPKPVISFGVDTICLHPNHMGNEQFQELEDFILANRKQIVDYADLLLPKAVKRNFNIWLEEKHNLFVRRIKKEVAENQVLHSYLEETFHSDQRIKRKKRIAGLPRLLLQLCVRKGS